MKKGIFKNSLSCRREKNFNTSFASVRNLREGNCKEPLSVCYANISPKGGDRQHTAFTLAEVLITLTIIGVIAAITIPNLMQNYRKHERITQIKTAYSIIQNAVKMSIAENGSPDGWGYDGSKEAAERFILPYLKVQYVCGQSSGDTPKRIGCFYDDGQNGAWYYINGSTASGSGSSYGAGTFWNVKLQNGMDLGIWAPRKNNQNQYNYKIFMFVFDVNGRKGPTVLGSDVFAFGMDSQEGKIRTLGTTNSLTETRAYISNETDINTLLSPTKYFACNKTAQLQTGYSCARVLELNHWEFPDNYPIKKF